jgi:hypothetical protein
MGSDNRCAVGLKILALDLTEKQRFMRSTLLREKYTRPPSDRMRRIHEWINSGKYPNAVTMGKDLEVTDRTVKRDISRVSVRPFLPSGSAVPWSCGPFSCSPRAPARRLQARQRRLEAAK